MLNYEEIKKRIIRENMDLVVKQYKNYDFQKKIIKYANKFGIPKEKIEEQIKNKDLTTLSIFAKDPSKQNFYEKTAAEYIKQIKGVKDFINLSNSGENALFIDKDNVRKRSDFVGELPSKSVDFQWIFIINNTKYYAFHKYIGEKGGAQDNQFNDILKSIVAARSNITSAKHKVLFICDGRYFIKSKIKVLANAIINENHKVLTIDELEKFLNEKNNKKQHSEKPLPNPLKNLLDKAINPPKKK